MNKDEMIEEMAKIANFSAFDFTQGTIQSKTIYTAMAEALYNAGCRKVGEEKTSREILQELLKDVEGLEYRAKAQRKTVKIEELIAQCNWIIHKVVPKTIKDLAKKHGIELED